MTKRICLSFLLLTFCMSIFSFSAQAQVNTITSNGKLVVDSTNTTKDYFEVSASDIWYMGWHKADNSIDTGPYFAVYKTSEGSNSAKWYSMQKIVVMCIAGLQKYILTIFLTPQVNTQ